MLSLLFFRPRWVIVAQQRRQMICRHCGGKKLSCKLNCCCSKRSTTAWLFKKRKDTEWLIKQIDKKPLCIDDLLLFLPTVDVGEVLSDGCPITWMDVARDAHVSISSLISLIVIIVCRWEWDIALLTDVVQYCTCHNDTAHSHKQIQMIFKH